MWFHDWELVWKNHHIGHLDSSGEPYPLESLTYQHTLLDLSCYSSCASSNGRYVVVSQLWWSLRFALIYCGMLSSIACLSCSCLISYPGESWFPFALTLTLFSVSSWSQLVWILSFYYFPKLPTSDSSMSSFVLRRFPLIIWTYLMVSYTSITNWKLYPLTSALAYTYYTYRSACHLGLSVFCRSSFYSNYESQISWCYSVYDNNRQHYKVHLLSLCFLQYSLKSVLLWPWCWTLHSNLNCCSLQTILHYSSVVRLAYPASYSQSFASPGLLGTHLGGWNPRRPFGHIDFETFLYFSTRPRLVESETLCAFLGSGYKCIAARRCWLTPWILNWLHWSKAFVCLPSSC